MNFRTDRIEWTTDMEGDWLKIKVDNPRTICEQLLENTMYDIEIKEHKEKRSLDANALFHLLVNKIAAKTGDSDDVVKKTLVIMYGALATATDGKPIGCVLPKGVDINDFYPYARWYKSTNVNGTPSDCYVFYKQTHTMNTKEFARLIDGTMDECKALGIETLPEDKVRAMLGEMNAQGN